MQHDASGRPKNTGGVRGIQGENARAHSSGAGTHSSRAYAYLRAGEECARVRKMRVRARIMHACTRVLRARAHSSPARAEYCAGARMREPQAIESAIHWAQNLRQSAIVSIDYIRNRTHRSRLVLGDTWLITILSIQRSPETICLSSTKERSLVSHRARPWRSSPASRSAMKRFDDYGPQAPALAIFSCVSW